MDLDKGYEKIDNIIFFNNKQYLKLLIDFENLEIECIESKFNIKVILNNYHNRLWSIVLKPNNETCINFLEKFFIQCNILKTQKYYYLIRIDPNKIEEVLEKSNNYIKEISLNVKIYNGFTIIFILSNYKEIEKVVNFINNYINNTKLTTLFTKLDLKEFNDKFKTFNITKSMNFKMRISENYTIVNNIKYNNVSISGSPNYFDYICNCINKIFYEKTENLYKKTKYNNYKKLEYLNLEIKNKKKDEKKIITTKYRVFDTNKKQIPIYKKELPENIFSKSL